MAREDPSDIPENVHSPAMVPLVNTLLKDNHVAKTFCDEEDYSIRVSPVVIPSPISVPTVVPLPKRVRPFKKRVRLMHSVSNLICL